MLNIVIPVDEIRSKIQAAEDELNRVWPQILERSAVRLVEYIAQDFATKSAGGTGASGVHWAKDKLDPSKPIGIETRRMRNSLKAFQQGEGWVISFTAAWSRHFDRERVLIPEKVPPEWVTALEKIVLEMAEEVVQEALDR